MTDRPDTLARVAPVLIALALALTGGALLLRSELVAAEAAAEEAACRAREDGLGELSCMNFSGLDTFWLTLWGTSLLAGAAGVGAASLWLASRPARPRVLLVCGVAAGLGAALWLAMSGGVWSGILIAACIAGGVALGTGVFALATAPSVSRTGS